MLKLLILADASLILGLSYCLLEQYGFRRHVDRIAELAVKAGGFALLVAVVLLASNLPGSAQLTNTLAGFTSWLHS
ncbi:MAG TPA: hypothetical protein VGJ04_10400 [Pirellulales bacterium]